MKRLTLISVSIFLLTNLIYPQDIINETGKDGKFIVRDAEQQEALVIEDGNVGITGELSVEQMPEGNVSNPYVVWDPEDKKFKTVQRIFSTVSPLSEPLETKSWHSIGYDGIDDDGISASVQGTAVTWNTFTTDFGYIKLGPANATAAHIYTDVTKFVFNKPVFSMTGEYSAMDPADLFFQTGVTPRMTIKASTGFMGIGTQSPATHLHVKGPGFQRIKVSSTDDKAAIQIDGNDSDGSWLIQNPENSSNLDFVNWSTANGNETKMTIQSDGNIGIGTTTPKGDLHVNGNGGLLVQGTYGNGVLRALGAGTRMHFYPKKAAFRAGHVDGAQWNDANIGDLSVAMGSSTTASGSSSFAMGGGTTASGYASTAMGSLTTASGYISTAWGLNTTASGAYSTAMGENTIASGNRSTAMGENTRAKSYASVAIGSYNVGGGTKNTWVLTEAVFEIGIGEDDDNRYNAMTVLKNGKVGIGTSAPGSKLSIVGLSEYTDNAAALAAGLTVGDLYRTGDLLKIVH